MKSEANAENGGKMAGHKCTSNGTFSDVSLLSSAIKDFKLGEILFYQYFKVPLQQKHEVNFLRLSRPNVVQ